MPLVRLTLTCVSAVCRMFRWLETLSGEVSNGATNLSGCAARVSKSASDAKAKINKEFKTLATNINKFNNKIDKVTH